MLEKIQKAIGFLQALGSHPLQWNDAALVKAALDELGCLEKQLARDLVRNHGITGIDPGRASHERAGVTINFDDPTCQARLEELRQEIAEWRRWADAVSGEIPGPGNYEQIRNWLAERSKALKLWREWSMKHVSCSCVADVDARTQIDNRLADVVFEAGEKTYATYVLEPLARAAAETEKSVVVRELEDWRQWAKGLVSVLPASDDYLRQKIGSGFHGFEEWNRWSQKELERLHLQLVWPLLREAGCDVRGVAERARVALSKELRDLSAKVSNLSGMVAKVRGIVG